MISEEGSGFLRKGHEESGLISFSFFFFSN